MKSIIEREANFENNSDISGAGVAIVAFYGRRASRGTRFL